MTRFNGEFDSRISPQEKQMNPYRKPVFVPNMPDKQALTLPQMKARKLLTYCPECLKYSGKIIEMEHDFCKNIYLCLKCNHKLTYAQYEIQYNSIVIK